MSSSYVFFQFKCFAFFCRRHVISPTVLPDIFQHTSVASSVTRQWCDASLTSWCSWRHDQAFTLVRPLQNVTPFIICYLFNPPAFKEHWINIQCQKGSCGRQHVSPLICSWSLSPASWSQWPPWSSAGVNGLQWSPLWQFSDTYCCSPAWSDLWWLTCSCLAAVQFLHSFSCSFLLVLKLLPLSPMYVLLHEWHGKFTKTLHLWSGCILTLGWTSFCQSGVLLEGHVNVLLVCRPLDPLSDIWQDFCVLFCLFSRSALHFYHAFVYDLFCPFFIAPHGYWQNLSACWMCSFCCVLLRLLCNLYNVLTTDILWFTWCPGDQRRSRSVCVGSKCILTLMPSLSVWHKSGKAPDCFFLFEVIAGSVIFSPVMSYMSHRPATGPTGSC